jgi:hypothetical protein
VCLGVIHVGQGSRSGYAVIMDDYTAPLSMCLRMNRVVNLQSFIFNNENPILKGLKIF